MLHAVESFRVLNYIVAREEVTLSLSDTLIVRVTYAMTWLRLYG